MAKTTTTTTVTTEDGAEAPAAPGLNIDAGIILGTTLVLLVAIACMALALKHHYAVGILA